MAGLKKRGRPRAAAPVADGVATGQVGAGIYDAQRTAGGQGAGPQAIAGREGWAAVKERLSALETNANPVCAVYWPEPVGAHWAGVYGTAKIYEGQPLAVTSDGAQHAL